MPETELKGRHSSASVTKALPSDDSQALELVRWSSPIPYVPLAQWDTLCLSFSRGKTGSEKQPN